MSVIYRNSRHVYSYGAFIPVNKILLATYVAKFATMKVIAICRGITVIKRASIGTLGETRINKWGNG